MMQAPNIVREEYIIEPIWQGTYYFYNTTQWYDMEGTVSTVAKDNIWLSYFKFGTAYKALTLEEYKIWVGNYLPTKIRGITNAIESGCIELDFRSEPLFKDELSFKKGIKSKIVKPYVKPKISKQYVMIPLEKGKPEITPPNLRLMVIKNY